MASSQIELNPLPAADPVSAEHQLNDQDFGPAQPDHASNIPPADRGKAAYLFLVACFMVEALVWGFAFSFGIFQDYYSREFAGEANIAVIGTCCMVCLFIPTSTKLREMLNWVMYRVSRTSVRRSSSLP